MKRREREDGNKGKRGGREKVRRKEFPVDFS